MNTKRAACSVAQLGGQLFVFGGTDEKDNQLKSIERLNVDRQDAWEIVSAEIPKGLCNVGLLPLPESSAMLVFGGLQFSGAERDVYLFDGTSMSKVGELAAADCFPNTVSICKQKGDEWLVTGKNFVHRVANGQHGEWTFATN